MNRKIKDIKRNTRGCSFKTVQGRAVFGHFIRKQMEAREQEAAVIRKSSKRRQQSMIMAEGRSKYGGWKGTTQSYAMSESIQVALDFMN
jgi:hypothetical protein